ncbi:uncharacterized protein TNCV_267631 [Trichonephila clavipes]|nr:uncharacterized protein TNCV_267631 [Trichonephila clavipes]
MPFGLQPQRLDHCNLLSLRSCTLPSYSQSVCDGNKASFQWTPSYRSVPLAANSTLDATRGLLATDHVILNHSQVTWTTPELAPPLLTTTPHQREDVSALDSFNVHRCPTRRVFSGIGLELVTRQATIRYLYHSATAATPRWWKSAPR